LRHTTHLDPGYAFKLRRLVHVLAAQFVNKMKSFLDIDDHNLEEALRLVATFGTDRYGYIVTPNVDHIIRHYQDSHFRALYAQAAYVLLDSRFLAHTVGLVKRQVLRVCLGSDLTTATMESIIKPLDVAIMVGGTPEQAQILKEKYGLMRLQHIDPPMNFIHDPLAVETCLREIEAASPFRFCFLAIGSPQQEIIAQKLKERGIARGLALCVGAAINFLTGIESRAPLWMQQAGLEWLYRLSRNPRRLWKRYLIRGPKIFLLLWRIELRVRKSAPTPGISWEVPVTGNTAAHKTVPIATSPSPT
jgi:exopolysaccharide biosynthesis WecB/TagA/CpsF family protein